jgi:hypothetical protein
MISNNSDTRHIKLPGRNKVLMVQESVNRKKKKSGFCLKYSKYGALTLIIKTEWLRTMRERTIAKREDGLSHDI